MAGNLFGWGLNTNGGIGDDSAITRSSPVAVGADTTWTKIVNVSGYNQFHTLGIKSDGTLWAWGIGTSGQLGRGNLTTYSSPVQVGALTTWTDCAVGVGHSLGIEGGRLWAWGAGTSGALGKGNTTSYSSPVQVGALTTWSKVAANDQFSAAIKTTGELFTWGKNAQGQLGLSPGVVAASTSSPVQVGTSTGWARVSCGAYHMGGIDGTTLFTWGNNSYGQLGDGTATRRSSPVQVSGGGSWIEVASGAGHTVAIKTGGSLFAFGYNLSGEVGDGTTTRRSSPVAISGGGTWTKVAAGIRHAGGIKSGNSLFMWGAAASGQTGHNNTTAYSSPVQVGALTTWEFVSAASDRSFGIQTVGGGGGTPATDDTTIIFFN